jgi:hypothetical protein
MYGTGGMMTEEEMHFKEVLMRYSSDELSVEEQAWLEAELDHSAQKRRWYREFFVFESQLTEAMRRQKLQFAVATKPVLIKAQSARKRRSSMWAAAALVLLSFVVGLMWPEGGEKYHRLEVQQEIRVNDYEAEELVGQEITFGKGDVRVHYENGANLVIQGPAAFEVTSDGVELEYGDIVAQSATEEGFRVEYQGSKIHSEKGAFAMSASSRGSVELFAFQGDLTIVGSLVLPEVLQSGEMLHSDGRDYGVSAIDSIALDQYREPLLLMYGVLELDGAELAYRREGEQEVTLTPEGLYVSDACADVALVEDSVFIGGMKSRTSMQSIRGIAGVRCFMVGAESKSGTVGKEAVLVGSITFDQAIVGVIPGKKALSKTDELVHFPVEGLDEGVSLVHKSRGINAIYRSKDGKLFDRLELSADRRTLHYELYSVEDVDQFRVLVANS